MNTVTGIDRRKLQNVQNMLRFMLSKDPLFHHHHTIPSKNTAKTMTSLPTTPTTPTRTFARSGTALILLGIYLILAGGAGYLSNPEGAKTALISGGMFGSLSIVCGALVRFGLNWARWAGLGLMALLAVAFIWRATVGWLAVAGGDDAKLFAASLISSMLLAVIIAATVTLKDR